MKKSVFVITCAALIGGVWLMLARPSGNDTPESEPTTEVAVRVDQITQTTLRGYVTAYGVIQPEPAGQHPTASANVAPFSAGVVVAVDTVEGQRVTKGDVLFRLDSRAADVAVTFAEKTLERQRRLLEVEGTSQRALQDAEQQLDAARVQQALLRVPSPLSGTVTRLYVKPGEAVDVTTIMAEVTDLSRLIVSAGVPSAELDALEVGQPVQVLAENSPAELNGTLSFISPRVDAQTGTAEVRVELSSDSGLRLGQVATIRIVSEERGNILAVPVESVTRDEEGGAVVAIVDGDTAVQRGVGTGLREGGLIEITGDGLRPGMTVVTEGAYGLPSETRVRVVTN